MADITLPPVQIGPIAGAAGQVECLGDATSGNTLQGSFGAPFKIGDAIYALQITSVADPGYAIRCYESLDAGLSWAEQDAAGAPAIDPTNEALIIDAVERNGVIYVAYFPDSEPTTGLRFASFTPGAGWTADVFPAISADLRVTLGGVLLQDNFGFDVRSDGEGVIVYGNTDGTNWNTVYRITTGGGSAWSAATVVATDGGTAPPGTITVPNWLTPKIVLDDSDNILGFLRQNDTNPDPGPVTIETFYYFRVDNTGALVTAATPIEAARPGGRSCATKPRIFNGDVLLPVALGDSSVSPATTAAALYTGSPATAPVWPVAPQIFEAAHEQLISIDQPSVVLMMDGTTQAYLAWIYQPRLGPEIEIRRSINMGSGWGTTGVFYDLLTNPPNATPASDQFISVLSGGQVASVGAAIGVVDFDLERGIGFFLTPSSVIVDPCRPAIDIGYPHEVHYPEVGAIKFDLFRILKANASSAQIAFQGVRRMKGSTPQLPQYRARPKTFTYKMTVLIPTVAGAGGDIIARQQVKDYDFELYNILILVTDASGLIAQPLGADSYAALWIRDRNRIAISNIPMLDLFYDGSPRGPYGDGSIVPPLYYPKDTQMQIDFRSTIADPTKAPATLLVYLIGRQYIPC